VLLAVKMMGLLSKSPPRKSLLVLRTVKMMGLLSKSPPRKNLLVLRTVKMTQHRTLALRT
jgi:hypothetical protein